MSNIILELDHIKKSFGETLVLKDISLSVERGEFITFLGSSGCGKTTTLRIIAGLEAPDHGRILLNGVDVTDKEPNQRNVNTVFQNYALFPHMDVYTNVAYGLKLRKVDKSEIRNRVYKILELVQLSGFEKRMPSELSGGQRQRVAIARAVVNNPEVLLLDEPLGALDLQLRRQMQLELKHLQKQLGITFIYITHDQEEAINMSDRIVVMRDGTFVQIGAPSEIYDKPNSSYVARFVGSANIIKGKLTGLENHVATIDCGTNPVKVMTEQAVSIGSLVTIAVRTENIHLSPYSKTKGIPAVVKEKSFVGGMLRIVLLMEDRTEVIASRHGINSEIGEGEKVSISWNPKKSVLVDLESPPHLRSAEGKESPPHLRSAEGQVT